MLSIFPHKSVSRFFEDAADGEAFQRIALTFFSPHSPLPPLEPLNMSVQIRVTESKQSHVSEVTSRMNLWHQSKSQVARSILRVLCDGV